MSDVAKVTDANRRLAERMFSGTDSPDDYAPDAVVWHSYDQVVRPWIANAARAQASATNPRDLIRDLRVFPHADGFAAQFRFVLPGDEVGVPSASFVAVVDGKVTRVDEYVNPPKSSVR
jgi:ketosteroid isomerase-like protein